MGLGREFDSFLLLSITQSWGGGGGEPQFAPATAGWSIASCYDYEGGRFESRVIHALSRGDRGR